MADVTEIAWADSTHNPWIGCQKVTEGCELCYAEADFDHRKHWVQWGPHSERRRTSESTRRQPFTWQRQAAKFVLVHGRRRRVFCGSLCDVFDNHRTVLPEWRDELWETIRSTPDLDWMLLTKRPENIAKMLPANWGSGWRNVWLGATMENQRWFDHRWPILSAVPAIVHFVSCEPMLGPVTIGDARPDWIICGGESSQGKRKARHMDLAWARSLRDECAAAGGAYFFKQVTDKGPIPDDLLVRQFPTPATKARAAA
jgi:protein gp37